MINFQTEVEFNLHISTALMGRKGETVMISVINPYSPMSNTELFLVLAVIAIVFVLGFCLVTSSRMVVEVARARNKRSRCDENDNKVADVATLAPDRLYDGKNRPQKIGKEWIDGVVQSASQRWLRPDIVVGSPVLVYSPGGGRFEGVAEVTSRGPRRARYKMDDGTTGRRSLNQLQLYRGSHKPRRLSELRDLRG